MDLAVVGRGAAAATRHGAAAARCGAGVAPRCWENGTTTRRRGDGEDRLLGCQVVFFQYRWRGMRGRARAHLSARADVSAGRTMERRNHQQW
jgi:hypothetical protein